MSPSTQLKPFRMLNFAIRPSGGPEPTRENPLFVKIRPVEIRPD
jgi:hypothetical protein